MKHSIKQLGEKALPGSTPLRTDGFDQSADANP
jgi:hypothetical protein